MSSINSSLQDLFAKIMEELSKSSVSEDALKEVLEKEITEPSILQEVTSMIESAKAPEITSIQEISQPPIAEQIIEPDSEESETNPLPFINYLTFNRLGLTIKNLNRILESDEDFAMHIIDCNSRDDTWDYLMSLHDKRIKSRTRFKHNLGPVYALNYNLTRRKPNQYFFNIDSDVYIKTENWLSKYMKVFQAFPEVGLLGVTRDNPYPRYMPPIIPRVSWNLSYLQLKNATVDQIMDFIPGCLQALRPELINQIGYWNEENGYGDAEIAPRINHYTSFKTGFITTVEIDMTQSLGCDQCQWHDYCTLNKSINSCFTLSKQSNMNESFARKFKWKYLETFKELEKGKRTGYCASILDPESRKTHIYHADWAWENFQHYLNKSN